MQLTVMSKPGPDGRNLEEDALVLKHIGKKVEKLEQRWGKPLIARAALEPLPVGYGCTLTLHGTPELAAYGSDETVLKAVDAAADKLTRQFEHIREQRTGRDRQRRGSGTIKIPSSF